MYMFQVGFNNIIKLFEKYMRRHCILYRDRKIKQILCLNSGHPTPPPPSP